MKMLQRLRFFCVAATTRENADVAQSGAELGKSENEV
jgi:hypothetical protein